MAQGPQRRRAGHRKRGCGNEADLIRQDGETVGRNGDAFGPAGLVDQSHDPCALGRPGAIGRRPFDDPDDVLAGYPAVRAYGEQAQFAAVQRGCADGDQSLVRARLWLVHLGEFQSDGIVGRDGEREHGVHLGNWRERLEPTDLC